MMPIDTNEHAAVPAAARAALRGQRGMTLLEIMIVLAIIALVMGFLVGPRVLASFQESKGKVAAMMVQQFANQAYPQWVSSNPSESCPKDLSELTKYMNKKDTKDPWGKEFIMLCGDKAPEGATTGFAVMSLGEDGKEGTADDIKSWEE